MANDLTAIVNFVICLMVLLCECPLKNLRFVIKLTYSELGSIYIILFYALKFI